jgi:hypothetical protein
LSALKSIELVDSKETAEYIIEGIGRVENLVDIQENGKTTAMAGENSNALLSVKLIYATSKKILLVVNENAKSDKRPTSMSVPDLVARHFWGKEATEAVVEKTVDQICKKMKWK